MASSTQRYVTRVVVRDVEKRYKPSRCYKFVLEVVWSDNSRHVIYRSYSEFFELHMSLVAAFPIEAGELDEKDRTLPKLSGSSFLQRTEVQKVAENRKSKLTTYCDLLLQLHPKISQFMKVLRFFELQLEDTEVPHASKTKTSTLKSLSKALRKNKKKRKSKETADTIEVTSPLQPVPYLVIATYKSKGKGQINLNEGDHVDVIDKNSNGWWYVSCNGIEGWAPATYLDPLTPASKSESLDEIRCLGGETFLSIRSYQADLEDELTFECNVVIEILNKVLDGWWIACYNGKVGYVPSTYLKPYNNPYLDPSFTSTNPSPKQPTPRRKTIKSTISALPSAEDLQIYRRVTEKRRQRSIKHQEPSVVSVPSLSALLGEMDDDGYIKPDLSDDGSYIYPDDGSYVCPDDGSYISPDFRTTGAKDLIPTINPPNPPKLPEPRKPPARDLNSSDAKLPSSKSVESGECDHEDVPPLYKAPSPPNSINLNVKHKGSPTSSNTGLLKPPANSPAWTPPHSTQQTSAKPGTPSPQSTERQPIPTPTPRAQKIKAKQSPVANSNNTKPATPNSLLRQKIPAPADVKSNMPDYLTVCDPPEELTSPQKSSLSPRTPPPKPPASMQTRLSKIADSDYQYEDMSTLVLPTDSQQIISPTQPKSNITSPTESAANPSDLVKARQHKKALPLVPNKNGTTSEKPPTNVLPAERNKKSPDAFDNPPRRKALPQPPSPNKNNSENRLPKPPNGMKRVADVNSNNIHEVKLKPVNRGVKDEKPHPINDTGNASTSSPLLNSPTETSGHGKIYEEMLVKPSQLKGKKSPCP